MRIRNADESGKHEPKDFLHNSPFHSKSVRTCKCASENFFNHYNGKRNLLGNAVPFLAQKLPFQTECNTSDAELEPILINHSSQVPDGAMRIPLPSRVTGLQGGLDSPTVQEVFNGVAEVENDASCDLLFSPDRASGLCTN